MPPEHEVTGSNPVGRTSLSPYAVRAYVPLGLAFFGRSGSELVQPQSKTSP